MMKISLALKIKNRKINGQPPFFDFLTVFYKERSETDASIIVNNKETPPVEE